MQAMKLADWLAEAKRRFGEDPRAWRFACPICKREQTLVDFVKAGADPQLAYQECLGRYVPELNCKYAAYGLFPTGFEVEREDGSRVRVLPFSDLAKTLNCGHSVLHVEAGACGVKGCVNEHQQE